jgi:hypothetical protein
MTGLFVALSRRSVTSLAKIATRNAHPSTNSG